jgi:hypothetical protein
MNTIELTNEELDYLYRWTHPEEFDLGIEEEVEASIKEKLRRAHDGVAL